MTILFVSVLFCVLFVQSKGDISVSGQPERSNSSKDSNKSEKNSWPETEVQFIKYKWELSKLLDEKLGNYTNHKILPGYALPTEVEADVEIREILRISEVDLNMKLNLVLDIAWNDSQLFHEQARPEWYRGVWVDDSVKNKIWTPTVSILNEEDSPTHSAGFVHDALWWSPWGQLLWRINIVTTVSCSMTFEDFPMDEQSCSILIGSPNYEDKEMKLTVVPFMYPVFSSSVKNVELIGVRVSAIVQHQYGEHQNPDNPDRTSYAYEMLLRRYVGYYIIGTYFPSALIVIISWLTFWMARNAAGERIALGVTCVLTITTLLISSQASSPKVSYIKAIDIYMGVCFTLVFSTLIQATAVSYLLRKVQKHVNESKLEGVENNGRPNQRPRSFASVVRRVMSGGLEDYETPKVTKFILRCDIWCRFTYPLMFFAFNVAYWSYYLAGSKYDERKGWKQPETYANVTDTRV